MQPPSLFNQLLEGRFAAEAGLLMAQLPLLRLQVSGGAGPVLVLPGFMADNGSTWLLRQFIEQLGYKVHAWRLGVNRGRMLELLPQVVQQVREIRAEANEPVRLLGWSRGGILAREVARDCPEIVRSVVTLGSPITGGTQATSIRTWLLKETGVQPAEMQVIMRQRQSCPITTRIHAIYSKTDGVVAWQACRDDLSPNVIHHEVRSSHVGMGCNADVFRLVAMSLAENS